MGIKKDYINLIRWSCIVQSFSNNYFIRVVVLYLLFNNVEPWVAVSIPLVFDFAKMLSRGLNFVQKIALKVNYKKYHIFHLISFLSICLIITQCRSIYFIYLLVMTIGLLTGIKDSSITALDTSSSEYESYCFIEEERSQVIGATLGLMVSQIVYDLSKTAYIIGFVVLIIIGLVMSLFLKNINNKIEIVELNKENSLTKEEKRNTIIITVLFGTFAGLWCMGWGGFEELAPLISNKIGYLNAVYTTLEIILLCIISGSLIKKIKQKRKLLLTETIIAIIDVSCLLIAALTLSWKGLLVGYIITAFTSTLGDPLWGSIISEYSTNNRNKYVLVNRVYFIVRAIFSVFTWAVCRECIIRGLGTFKYLAIIIIVMIVVIYFVSNKINKKVFGSSI